MLIAENGASVGTVSGGCLEADVLERAKKVIQTDEPAVITYDTTANENSVFGLSMGCRGISRILLEPLEKESFLIRVLQIAAEQRERRMIATLISSSNDSFIGGRMFYDSIEQFHFKNLPSVLENSAQLQNDCLDFFAHNKPPAVRHYQIENTEFELFLENINPPLSLLIFGAGFDALPLIRLAKELGWRVTVIDHRSAYANAARIPEADEIIVAAAENLDENLFNDENCAAVIMTHNYERDPHILRRLMKSHCFYIGALGPKKRTENLLTETGETFSNKQLERLYAPVGLDIGADTPELIALSIVAEIQTVLTKRGGGFLRNRQAAIYNRDA